MDALYNKTTFKTSEVVTKAYSTSFSIAVSMLNPEWRKAIYSIYGFVRFADEIVDTFHESQQQYLLNKIEGDLQEAINTGVSLNPILHSFAITVNKYNISQEHIRAFMKSMRADLIKKDYNSVFETNEYIYGSAEVVGLMCLMVFVEGNKELYNQLEGPAKRLGAAFQKVNFLRDLKADYEGLERTYFAGFSPDTFDEAYKNCWVKDIQEDFAEALKGIKRLPGRSRFAVYVAYLYYKRLLRNLKVTPAKQLINTRIRVRNRMKFVLLFKAAFDYKLRLIPAA